MNITTYREQFSRPNAAEKYERIYTERTYSNVLWEVEKALLREIVSQLRQSVEEINYLDFAAGTGRVISYVEYLVDTATGIEISPAMAEIAQAKLSKGTMLVKDISQADDQAEDRYDLITAFRFILNAEPALRLAAMKRLAARMRDDKSLLVFNNHGSLFSHKALMWPYHRLRALGKGYRPEGNVMTERTVLRLARNAGLQIRFVTGYGVLSDKLMRLSTYEKTVEREKRLARGAWLSKLGCNRLYVATRA